jgi:large subunit ribosomal protein L25
MKSVSLDGIARVKLGKRFSKEMRKNGQVPCVIYGGSKDSPIHICIESKQLKKVIFTPNVYKLNISVEKESYEAIIRDIQFHPVNDEIIHVDFLQIQEDKLVSLEIPIKLTGNSIGVLNGGRLNLVIRKLIVRALPNHIPDDIEIDISQMRIGHSKRIVDIDLDNIEFLHPSSLVVVAIKTARAVVEEEIEESEGGESEGGESEGGSKPAEGGGK